MVSVETYSTSPAETNLGLDFTALRAEIESFDLHAIALAVLGDILTITTDEGHIKTFQEIDIETEQFFANPIIQQSEELMNSLVKQYASFCGAHGHIPSFGLELPGMKVQGDDHTSGLREEIDSDDEEDEEKIVRGWIRKTHRRSTSRRQK